MDIKRTFDERGEGMYMGEVVIGAKELQEAVDGAQRLIGEHVYSDVKVTGDKAQCSQFGSDVVRACEMLLKLTQALTKASKVPGTGTGPAGEVN